MKRNFQAFFGTHLIRTATVCVCALITAIAAPHAIADDGDNAKARTPNYVDGESSPLVPEITPSADRELKLDYSSTPAPLHIVLPPMDTTEKQRQSAANAKTSRPLQIGLERDMPSEYRSDISPRIEWISLEDGSFVGTVSVTSPDASAMRIAIHAELTAAGEIRFFGKHPDQRFPVFTQPDFHLQDDEDEIGVLWSPTVEGDTIGIEITLPSRKALSAFSLRVGAISHIWRPIDSLLYTPEALDCANHIDVQCRVGRFPRNTENAVAHILFQKNGGSYQCSGTLLNDSAEGTFIPYFLTAHHCVSTVSVARSVDALWFYQRRSCRSNENDRRLARTTGGADLLATRGTQDSTLLRFRRSVPSGLLYSGWSISRVFHPTSVYGIHHPDGGVKKYSAGRTIRTTDWTLIESGIRVVNGYDVDWSEGTTETGSSGSGLFHGQHLIGVLSGGSGGCYTNVSGYGSFRDFYPLISRYLEDTTPPPPTDDHGNTRATATVVRAPSSTSGNLESSGDKDYFRIELRESGRLQVQTTGNTDTYGTLFRGTTKVEEDDDDGASNNFRITLPNAQAGTYYIEVRGYTTTTRGAYTLRAEFSGSPTPPSPPNSKHLPLVTAASNAGLAGFVRIINHSNRAGTVSILAFDDEGGRAGPVTLSLEASSSVHLTSADLENGNASKGLSAGIGQGAGHWRLELTSELNVEPLAYVRTPDGFLSSMHEMAAETAEGSNRYHVPFFNPASNTTKVSLLRLINPGDRAADVVITGVDDLGEAAPSGEARLRVGPGAARLLTARQLEGGGAGVTGRLGDGAGKWRLSVASDRPLRVMSLLQLETGQGRYLANLSRGQTGVSVDTSTPPPPPESAPDLVVQSPAVSESTLSAGQSFTLEATVRNQGDARSATTTLRYYRSSDAAVSTGDARVGTDAVGALSASGTSSESITLRAPSSAGAWYYGACVDSVSGESDTGNNCSTGVRVTVRPPPDSADLSIGRVSVNVYRTIRSGLWSAYVHNIGEGPSPATTLRVTSGGRTLATGQIDALRGSSVYYTYSDYVWGEFENGLPAVGAVVRFCADRVANESNVSNNCKTYSILSSVALENADPIGAPVAGPVAEALRAFKQRRRALRQIERALPERTGAGAAGTTAAP